MRNVLVGNLQRLILCSCWVLDYPREGASDGIEGRGRILVLSSSVGGYRLISKVKAEEPVVETYRNNTPLMLIEQI